MVVLSLTLDSLTSILVSSITQANQKSRLGQMMKSLPLGKATWTDILPMQNTCPDFILTDLTNLKYVTTMLHLKPSLNHYIKLRQLLGKDVATFWVYS